MAMFARFGVPEYWIVDPARNTLEMYILSGSQYRRAGTYSEGDVVTSSTLPGLILPAPAAFAE